MKPDPPVRLRAFTTVYLLILCGSVVVATPAAAQSPASDAAATTTAPERPALFDEPRILANGISWVEHFGRDEAGKLKDGFYPEPGRMITGAGWISAGPGFRHHLSTVAHSSTPRPPSRGGGTRSRKLGSSCPLSTATA